MGHFRWRGMETETKQRQDINQGNATAWQTANDTTRKRNKKRETEISVRGASALAAEEPRRRSFKSFHCFLRQKRGESVMQSSGIKRGAEQEGGARSNLWQDLNPISFLKESWKHKKNATMQTFNLGSKSRNCTKNTT